jgi:hypothetical protein
VDDEDEEDNALAAKATLGLALAGDDDDRAGNRSCCPRGGASPGTSSGDVAACSTRAQTVDALLRLLPDEEGFLTEREPVVAAAAVVLAVGWPQ